MKICYQKTIIKNTLDIIIYFYKHLNINYNINEINDVLIWDSELYINFNYFDCFYIFQKKLIIKMILLLFIYLITCY